MKRILLSCIFSVLVLGFAGAQTISPWDDWDSEEENVPHYTIDDYAVNNKGDQLIHLSVEGFGGIMPRNLKYGGGFSLGYNVFQSAGFSFGATFDPHYGKTRGSNVFYFVPVMAKGTFYMTVGRFEIPVSISAGAAMQSYLSQFYLGPSLKPEIGVYYRQSADWSVGLTVGATVLPQIYFGNTASSMVGSTINAGLSVRYHF